MVRVKLVSHCDLSGPPIQGLLDAKPADDDADTAANDGDDDNQSYMVIVHAFNFIY